MRALLCLSTVVIVSVFSVKCPQNYQVVDDRCLRTFLVAEYDSLAHLAPIGRSECSTDGATMPIIRNDKDKQLFVNYGKSLNAEFLVLDLICNPNTRKMEWGDGTAVGYPPIVGPLTFDCVEWDLSLAIEPKQNDFITLWEGNKYPFTVVCEIEHYEESAGYCPPGYELGEDDWCILTYYQGSSMTLKSLLPKARDACGTDGAHLPIIRNDRENAIFNKYANSRSGGSEDLYLVLDLICNWNVLHLTWVDGTTVDYHFSGPADFKFDCVTKPSEMDVAYPSHNFWTIFRNDAKAYFMALCVKKSTPMPIQAKPNGTIVAN